MRGVGFYGTKNEETKMDYRELLKKYMEEVGVCEGVFFIDGLAPPDFTHEEVVELNKIAEEIK